MDVPVDEGSGEGRPQQSRDFADGRCHDHTLAGNGDRAGCDEMQRMRIQPMLSFEHARGETTSSVARHDGYRRLSHDRSGVHFRANEVHAATRDQRPLVEHALMRIQARKCR